MASPDHDTIEDPPRSPVAGYTTLAVLGRGGMGEVYRARRDSDGALVALKVIRLDKSDDQFVARFEREIAAAMRIPSPHIVRVLAYGHEPVPFAAMELVEGGSVRDLVKAHGKLPVAIVLRLVDDLLAGLGAAHGEGVVHRDVKPHNLLITADGRVKVADFGIARVIDQTALTATGGILGTPAYMSPEQVRGERVTGASDLFAVGIVMYELLTGATPFQGEDAAQTMAKIVRLRHRTVGEVAPRVPDIVDAFVERLLAASEKRLESAAQARAVLAPILARYGGTSSEVAQFLAAPTKAMASVEARARGAEIGAARAALRAKDEAGALAITMRLLAAWPGDADVRALVRDVQGKTVNLRPSASALALLRRAENEADPLPTLREAARVARQESDPHLERVAHARILQVTPDDEESGLRARPRPTHWDDVERSLGWPMRAVKRALVGAVELVPFLSWRGKTAAVYALAPVVLVSGMTCAYCAGFGNNPQKQRALIQEAMVLAAKGNCDAAHEKIADAIAVDKRSPIADEARALRATICKR